MDNTETFLLHIVRGQPGTTLAWTAATLPADDWNMLQGHVASGRIEFWPDKEGGAPSIHVIPFADALDLLRRAGDIDIGETLVGAIRKLPA